MNTLRRPLIALVGFCLAAALAPAATPAPQPATSVSLSEIPAPARRIIQTHQGNGRIASVRKTSEDGGIVFEVEVERGGKTYDFSVEAGGKGYSIDLELSETPPAVQRKAKELSSAGTLDNVSKVLEEGTISFEIELTLQGRYHAYELARNGRVLSHSVEAKLTELPAAVQATIRERVDPSPAPEIYGVEEEGENYIQVEGRKAGKDISINVAPNGRFLGENE